MGPKPHFVGTYGHYCHLHFKPHKIGNSEDLRKRSQAISRRALRMLSGRRSKRAKRCLVASMYILYIVLMYVLITQKAMPVYAQYYVEENMPPYIERHLTYEFDGLQTHYFVERYDPFAVGYIDVNYTTASNTLSVSCTNIKNLTIYCRSMYIDNSEEVFGINPFEDSNYFKKYFIERNLFNVNVFTLEPIQELVFVDIPIPQRVRVNGEDWYEGINYEYSGDYGVVLSHVPAGSTAIDLYFQTPETSAPIAKLYVNGEGGVDGQDSELWVRTDHTVIFDAGESYDPDGSIVRFYYDLGEGNFSSGPDLQTISYTFPEEGNYGVILTVEDDTGLINRSYSLLHVYKDTKAPDIQIVQPTSAVGDVGYGFVIEDILTPDDDVSSYHMEYQSGESWVLISYQFPSSWVTGTGGVITLDTHEIPNGIQNLRVAATDTSGNTYYTYATVLVDNSNPTAVIGGDLSIEEDDPRLFDAAASYDNPDPGGSGIANWTWYFGDGTVGYGETVSKYYGKAGDYSLLLVVRDAAGNEGMDAAKVTVANVPPIADAGSDREVNEGEELIFDGTGSTDTSSDIQNLFYAWDFDGDGDFGDGSGLHPKHVFAENGVYTVTLKVMDDDGASDTDTLSVVVRDVVNHPPEISSVPDVMVHYDYPYILDLNPYITDIDTPFGDIIVATDSSYVMVDGVNLIMEFPESMIDQEIGVTITVFDGFSRDDDYMTVRVTENFPPSVSEMLEDVEFFEGEILSGAFRLNDYFTDMDGDALTYQVIGNEKVKVVINEDSSVSFYSQAHNWGGLEKITFRAYDSYFAFAEQTIYVTVIPVNEPPKIDLPSNYFDIPYNRLWTVHLDPYITDDDDIRIMAVDKSWIEVRHMDLVFNYSSLLPFDPLAPPHETATLRVTDGIFNTSVEIHINVTSNVPPVLVKVFPNITFDEDENIRYAVVLDDYFEDMDGQVTRYSAVAKDSNVSVEINEDGALDLSSALNWNGATYVVVTAFDNENTANYAPINVFVNPVNDAPVYRNITKTTVEPGERWLVDLDDYFSDIDSDKLFFSCNRKEVRIDPLTNIAWWDAAKGGNLSGVIFTASDGLLSIESESLDLIVLNEEPSGLSYLSVALATAILTVVGVIIYRTVKYRYSVEEVFLINNAGLLLSHVSNKPSEAIDKRVIGAMLQAVQSFVMDSLSSHERSPGADKSNGKDRESLETLKYGDLQIIIERTPDITLAVVINGYDNERLRSKMRNVLEEIDKKFGDVVRYWNGDMGVLNGLNDIIKREF